MNKLLLFVLFFFSSLSAKSYTYNLSICAMFKDDAPYLKEWIEYHRLLGVEHFWFYDNGSSDNSLEILTPYIQEGIVELTSWPSPVGRNWIGVQHQAYMDCLQRSKNSTKWLAVIDSDEFIVPIFGKDDLYKILREYEKKPDCGGLVLSWLMFGTSNVYDVPPQATMIETLLMRSSVDYPPNAHVKTICRPDRTRSFQIHAADYLPQYRDYTLAGVPNHSASLTQVLTTPIRINHYWTRTVKYFDEVKVPRRLIFNGRPYSEEEIEDFNTDLNAIYDDAILQYVPDLKKRLGYQ